MQIIIPMTGYGSRFVAAGYKELKPFISVFRQANDRMDCHKDVSGRNGYPICLQTRTSGSDPRYAGAAAVSCPNCKNRCNFELDKERPRL